MWLGTANTLRVPTLCITRAGAATLPLLGVVSNILKTYMAVLYKS